MSTKSQPAIVFEHHDRPVVSIVIPVFNQWNYTLSCLQSIFVNSGATPYEIIIGDDVSSDETVNIRSHARNIKVIRNSKNLGFLHNCNTAATHARGEFLLFLNNDTNVKAGWLESLVTLIQSDHRIGMVGSKLIYASGELQEAGGVIFDDASGMNFGRLQPPANPEFNYVRETDYISGACIMIRKSLWEELGGFDTRFSPAYYEDTDLAFSVRKLGYKVLFQPKSEVIHFEGISHGVDLNSGIKSYQNINKEKFYQKWQDVLTEGHFKKNEHLFWARDRSRDKQCIVVMDSEVPRYDTNAGGKATFLYLKLLLSMGLNVKFIPANFKGDEPYTSTLQQLGIEVLFGDHYSENWQSWIVSNRDYIDLVLLNRPWFSAQFIDFIRENSRAGIIYQGHDLHHLRFLRSFCIDNDLSTYDKIISYLRLELGVMGKSDVIVAFSDYEKRIIQSLLPQKCVHQIPLFFYDDFAVNYSKFDDRAGIMFVGGFSHAPNTDAVLWFSKNVLPKVLKCAPDLVFYVVGANPPEEVRLLESENVKVLGYLEDSDLVALYNSTKLTVIPLRFGAGVKGKTLEAMYYGSPVVATTIALEGLEGISGTVEAVDLEDDFASAVLHLYHAPSRLSELAAQQREYLASRFSSQTAVSIIKTILSNCAAEKKKRIAAYKNTATAPEGHARNERPEQSEDRGSVLEQELAPRKSELAELEQRTKERLTASEKKLVQLEQELVLREKRLIQAEQRTQDLLCSASWRITAPLRWIYEKCFRVKGA
jgi:O-antigen biosynthesis protein